VDKINSWEERIVREEEGGSPSKKGRRCNMSNK
jgi:hypothetical protein